MNVHVFKSFQRNIYGFDAAPTGANLPLDKGPWKFVRCIDTDKVDVAEFRTRAADIRRDLTLRGFHVAS